MKFFHFNLVKCLFIFVWCLTLLHMTFFMASVYAFKLNDNKALMENVKKLLAQNAFEEETDSGEPDSRSTVKIVDLLMNHFHQSIHENREISLRIKNLLMIGGIRSGYFETFSPPPDAIS